MAKATLIGFCFAVFISAVHCRFVRSSSDEYFYFQLENGTVIKEDLTVQVANPQAFNADSVSLYLYTQKTGGDNPCRVTSDSCENWKNCGFDPSKVTVVLVHGYLGNYNGEGMQNIKNAYLAKKDINFIIVDYSPVNCPYLVAVFSAKRVGQASAKVISYLQENCGVDRKNIECVGHSLGSHICGLFCAALPEKCARITALDPASPIISLYGNDGRLDKSDADNLQIIHTSSKNLGDKTAYGHIDFYPNGAKNQYGCDPQSWGQILAGGCDHTQACNLFADTILHPTLFKTNLECASAKAALAGTCTPSTTLAYVGDSNNRSDCGIFYVNTKPIYENIVQLK